MKQSVEFIVSVGEHALQSTNLSLSSINVRIKITSLNNKFKEYSGLNKLTRETCIARALMHVFKNC